MSEPVPTTANHWAMLGMFAACCVVPMLLIVLLTTVAGLTLGLSAAVALGVVAASLCAGLMVFRHRSHGSAPQNEG